MRAIRLRRLLPPCSTDTGASQQCTRCFRKPTTSLPSQPTRNHQEPSATDTLPARGTFRAASTSRSYHPASRYLTAIPSLAQAARSPAVIPSHTRIRDIFFESTQDPSRTRAGITSSTSVRASSHISLSSSSHGFSNVFAYRFSFSRSEPFIVHPNRYHPTFLPGTALPAGSLGLARFPYRVRSQRNHKRLAGQMDGQPQRQELRSDGEPREEEVRNGEANATACEMADSLPQGTEAEAGLLLEGMEPNDAHNSSSFGTANGSTSPPHPTPPPPLLSLLSLLLLRLSRALTTLPTPSDLRFTLLTIIAISPLMGLFASWAHAFYLPQAGFPIPLILFVFVFPSFWEELFWRVLLNPHPAEPPSTLPSWLHTRITSLLSRASSLLAPFLSSIPFLRALSLPRDWPADPKVFYGIVSTSLYVLAHPFLAWLNRPAALRLFSHPGFLLCCVVLGSACLVVYRRSGSAWAAILVHWMAVSVWMCLGGRHQAPF